MSWLIMMAGSCHETEDYELAANYRQEIWDLLEPEKRPFQLYVDLADEYRQFGDTQRALEIYEQAEKEFPEDPERTCGRSWNGESCGRWTWCTSAGNWGF